MEEDEDNDGQPIKVCDKKPCYEWEPDEWEGPNQKSVENMQNLLKELNIIEIVGNLIMSDEYEADLKYEAVLLCIGLLLGGNKVIQDTFEEFLIKDSQNLFILSLKQMINSAFEIV